MEKNVIKHKKNRNAVSIRMVILFFLFTVPFFQVDFFVDTIDFAGKAYTGCQIIVGAAIAFLLLKDRLVKKLTPLLWLFFALFFVLCLASGVNGGNLKLALGYSFATMVFCLVVQYGILKDLKSFLVAEMIFFGILTGVNFITVLTCPNGLYTYLEFYRETWFLGFKSGHIIYQLAFLFFSIMYVALYDKTKRFIPCAGVVIVLISNILVKNSTATIILIPIAAVLFIPPIIRFTKVMNILTYTGIGVFLELIIVIFRKQEIFSWLIVGILHKGLDLSYREGVWNKAMESIREFPVIGHGYQDFVYSPTIVTTHNEVLEVLYKTGFVGLGIFLAILAFVIWKLFKYRKLPGAGYIAIFIGMFFMMFVVEQYAFVYFFYLFVFAASVDFLGKRIRGAGIGNFAKGDGDEGVSAGTGIPSEGDVASKGDGILGDDAKTGSGAENKPAPSRAAKSARNFIFAALANAIAIIIGLLAQRLFIHILGLEYAGLNGLFSNILTMLCIADLGIGEAVIFHLYNPLKDDDKESILSLMRFYRKAFHIIGVIIAAGGLCLIPALPYIAHTTEVDVNLTLVYIIFLADVVFSYFLSYKRALLYADQKNFIISLIHMGYLIGMNTAQLLVLYFTRNYYAYILTKVAFRILENLVITKVANRLYPFLKDGNIKPLQPEVRSDIKKKTGALFFHKIGTFAVNGTDNILISVFLSLVTAGLYNNYYLVIDAATKLINPAISALTPSVGNMLISEDIEHRYKTFRRIRFMNFWIATFASTMLFVMIQPFIGLWFGEEYLLPIAVIIMLTLQFFQSLMRSSYNVFQDGAGIFYENRFVPLFESGINLAASLILLNYFGLAGVFAGTLISSLALWCFSYPKFVYTKLFKRSVKHYILETLGYLGLFAVVIGVTSFTTFTINNALHLSGLPGFVADLALCFVIPNAMMLLFFFKTDCFRYFLGLIRRRVRR